MSSNVPKITFLKFGATDKISQFKFMKPCLTKSEGCWVGPLTPVACVGNDGVGLFVIPNQSMYWSLSWLPLPYALNLANISTSE